MASADAYAPIPRRPLGRTGQQVTIFGLGGEGVLRTHGREAEATDLRLQLQFPVQ